MNNNRRSEKKRHGIVDKIVIIILIVLIVLKGCGMLLSKMLAVPNDYIEKVKIRPIRLHEFRHSHATLLNILWHTISGRLGHSSTKITIDTYTHANKE